MASAASPGNGGGFGFHQVFKSLAAQWGQLRFRSGEGCIRMDGTGLDADRGEERDLPYLGGFQVAVCCRAARTLSVQRDRN